MTTQPLSRSEREYVEGVIAALGGRRTIRKKRCWYNAQRMMVHDKEGRFWYWECADPIPHAWVTINDKVVDITAEAAARSMKRRGFPPPYCASISYENGRGVSRKNLFKDDSMRFHGFSLLVWTYHPRTASWTHAPRKHEWEPEVTVAMTAKERRHNARLLEASK
jgi:hypothetical protein